MPERGGDVAFDEEVTVPSKAIAKDGDEEDEPPVEKEGHDQHERACQRPQKMPASSRGLRMLSHIERPELFQASEFHVFTSLHFTQAPLSLFLMGSAWKPKQEIGFFSLSFWD